jgi:hypothetical protein
MRSSVGTALLLLVACQAQEPDKLLMAICARDKVQLQQIIDAAAAKGKTIEVPDDASVEALRSAVYTHAQGEVPGQEPKPFPGCEGVPLPSSTPAAASATGRRKAPASQTDVMAKMADMLMKTKDLDKDGKLSREEMKQLVDSTNAQAKASGQPEVDFFKSVDKDGDDLLNQEELEAFFRAQQGAMGAGAKAAKPAKAKPSKAAEGAKAAGGGQPDYGKLMFKGLDKNGDGELSREEMQPIIEKTNQQTSNQANGEKGEDFFDSMDKNGNGSIDQDEAATFFAGVAAMLAKGGGAGGKDEV